MNLILVQSRAFNSVVCDLWQNENGDVFMTRKQIGEALEYSEPETAIRKIHKRHEERLDQFSVQTKLVGTDGKQYETFIYNEKGIYEVIRKSQQPKADEFYDFVYDLLESLRKGELKIVQTQPQLPTNYKEALLALVKEVEKNEQLEIEKQMYQQQVADMQPIVTYVDEVLKCTDLLLTSQIAEDYGMSAYALNKLLNEHGIQYSLNKQWLLYSKFKGQGYTKSETKEYKKPDGSTGVRLHTKWTQKGRLFLYETLKAKGILPTMERMKLKLIEGNKQLA
ncbi:phage antirepressor KilAC domain-containing protein [Lysinibacillus sp. ACHW1.5]|uniref:phage antirepressor KilAC domain-containing protein n=1 Tax=Lysinibacillus sp. ACHW1.5 TaxID=2913506 RepID=UPI001EDAA4D9|nr:phage antirepressor KilAC domain-containing protein [Lysinibacillus sp. ACHW1.5]UKJ44324.1 phage antirepressor KilAC domain-containing protein [Lysinibacillus sp. ACHW1.5]